MLGSCSNSGGWRIASGGMPQRSGSVDMDTTRKAIRNVWASEESFVSPPQHTSLLGASPDSEESSEDYISGLAEEIAQSMLQEEEVIESHAFKLGGPWGVQVPKPAWSSHKMGTSPTSPQSTLTGFNWDSSSNKGSSGVPSPPTPQDGTEAVDALYGELLRLKLEDQVRIASQQRMLSLQQQIIRRPSSTAPDFGLMQRSMPSPLPCGNKAGRPNENVLCAAIERAMVAKQGRRKEGTAEVRGGGGGGGKQMGERWSVGGGPGHQGKKGAGGNNGRRRGEEQQQQQHFSLFASNVGGAGGGVGGGGGRPTQAQMQMRAVFLGAPASRECGGTGVFLPRRLGSTHHQDSRRKPACSTVLLPSHIVEALNLNVEDTLPRRDLSFSHQRHLQNSQIGRHRYEPKEEICSSYFPMSHSTTLQEVAPNISLPSEWTY